jgi:amidase/aspartyl-tRNA(Asn)/glutamyl-tRNA(Gln) amidotransferase subunit A
MSDAPCNIDLPASAVALARRIRAREISALELLDATITRIQQRNPSLNAVVFTAFEEARVAARDADVHLASDGVIGPFHGVPTMLKDLFDFKPGWPVTYGGIPALRGMIADCYCAYAERIEAAGAIVVGKGNSPVMGLRGTCDNPLFGPTRNPFDLTRNSGGSSGGCAAAVADGLLPLAEGGDGGGSIRIPAAWCGIYGFKPSLGRVPSIARPNAFANIDPFCSEGPLARTVEDAALALSVLAGPDVRDPFSTTAPFVVPDLERASVRGMRIGYTADYGGFPVDAGVAATVAAAVGSLAEAGARVEPLEFRLPYDQHELSDLWCRLIIPGNVVAIEALKNDEGIDLIHDTDDLPWQYRDWLRKGRAFTVLDRARDEVMRTQLLDAFNAAFETCDLIVGPTVCAPPVPNASDGNTLGPSMIGEIEVDPLIGWCPTYLVNFTGHPAASAPAGLHEGLPVGLHLIGRRDADADVLRASAVLESVRPWTHFYDITEARTLDDQ